MSLGARLGLLLTLALSLVTTSGVAAAGPTKGARASDRRAAKAKPRDDKGKKGVQSIGSPNAGRLVGAARLRGSRSLRQRVGAHSWGLPVLVKMLRRAADKVAQKHRGAMLLVGDLSGRNGGRLDGHNSHQSGRDVDVGFYVANSRGKTVPVKRFIAFDANGRARDLPWATFDEARNWALVEALLKDEKVSIRYLFISNALRGKLLAYAAKKRAPKSLVERAAAVMMSPADADLHDDHFHVRIACPESMRGVCQEESRHAPKDAPQEGEKPAPAKAKAGASDGDATE